MCSRQGGTAPTSHMGRSRHRCLSTNHRRAMYVPVGFTSPADRYSVADLAPARTTQTLLESHTLPPAASGPSSSSLRCTLPSTRARVASLSASTLPRFSRLAPGPPRVRSGRVSGRPYTTIFELRCHADLPDDGLSGANQLTNTIVALTSPAFLARSPYGQWHPQLGTPLKCCRRI